MRKVSLPKMLKIKATLINFPRFKDSSIRHKYVAVEEPFKTDDAHQADQNVFGSGDVSIV